tara:strand:- start:349 stop:579 length:231 start_codon:yes stop_codon:yes gene_type:complete
MNVKSFSEKSSNVETPNDIIDSEKPLISEKNKTKRVDINVLKSKLEEQESKEFKKNLSIFSLCALLLGAVGVYLSL